MQQVPGLTVAASPVCPAAPLFGMGRFPNMKGNLAMWGAGDTADTILPSFQQV
ncbi:hypothetical protein GCM10011499_15070 [Pelagibacterium lentulum]|uniref:Uncharacterized protein n=1 Tax=Pelagibacterium lentulum TaxID=2029865 RepID=A0A916R9M5_9HYPH|nr:hypothetical protein GCM10011499_15070 [Pelagibacterium lentulum]